MKKLGVIFGGMSTENKVSCISGASVIKNLNKEKYEIFPIFIDEEGNQELHGIIDLMLVYDDHIDIIDYKLSNIYDDDYDEQLNGYYKYIQKKTDKKIHLYLYSLISGEYREVKKVD